MKKLALAFVSASALVFGLGMVAEAQGYGESVTVNPAAPTAGGAYTAAYQNCIVGETITFSQPESTPASVTGVCTASTTLTGSLMGILLPQQAVLGNATGSFTAAPTAPRTYVVTATSDGDSPVQTTTFTIAGDDTTTTAPVVTTVPATVPGGGLPATGSDGINTTTGIAVGLLVVGLGLFAVAQVRRRQAPNLA